MDSLAHVERIHCTKNFPVTQRLHVPTIEEYRRQYDLSISQPGKFWSQVAADFTWKSPLPTSESAILNYNFDLNEGPIEVQFLKGVKTNISYNLLDRIINKGSGERIAYFWEGNEVGEQKSITYSELRLEVVRFANALKRQGITPGDRVAIYLPVTIELVVAMLACARIGAIHTVVVSEYFYWIYILNFKLQKQTSIIGASFVQKV